MTLPLILPQATTWYFAEVAKVGLANTPIPGYDPAATYTKITR